MADIGKMRRVAGILFAYGFRPFFLLAGLYAVVSIAAWLWIYHQGGSPLMTLPPQYWHGHEMIFGFIAAAIAGFLLTAVPSWTGRRGFSGLPLAALTALWLAGRAAMFLANELPIAVLAAAELSFLPALMLTIAPSLLRSANRNTPMLAVVAAFWAADGIFVHGLANADPVMSRAALLGALDLVLVLITVIGGRIVPAFTGNALRNAGADVSLRSNSVVERLVIVAMFANGLFDLVARDSVATGIVAASAAALQVWRQSGWHGWRTGGQPIVWVLHLAYVWLPVGLVLKSAWLICGPAWAGFWQHALAAGAAGTMILAVMTRAALGHTGRPLRVNPSIAIAYLLLTLSVVVRVFGGPILPFGYPAVVTVAGTLWVAAFVPYLLVYGPILVNPRADGRPG